MERACARWRFPASAAALLLVPFAFPAAAQTTPRGGGELADPHGWPSLGTLVARSSTIVAGEVVGLESSWNADRTDIFTTVTLRVDRRLLDRTRRPDAADRIRFQTPGGTVGRSRLLVTHMATFQVGERALVFLSQSGPRLPEVVAGEAGKRRLRPSPDGGWELLPAFPASDTHPGAHVLDDLAAALPGLLTAAR